MKLDQAIEIATELLEMNLIDKNPGRKGAVKLLIEAGKVLKHGRRIGPHHDPMLLEGETKD